MARGECPGERMRKYGNNYIRIDRDDEKIVRNLSELGWYSHRDPYHRMFRRELYEEARRRGLKVAKFVFNPLGT